MATQSPERTVRLAETPDEIAAGLSFVRAQYQKAFGVDPSPPDHLLIARLDSRVVGTIGVNVWHEETGLRLAHLYTYNPATLPFPFELPDTVEFARWASESSGVACSLIHAAVCFSLSLKKKYGLCEHSLAVNRVCRQYGIIFYPITDAKRNAAMIEESHQLFYDSIDAKLFVFILAQSRPALEAYLKAHSQ